MRLGWNLALIPVLAALPEIRAQLAMRDISYSCDPSQALQVIPVESFAPYSHQESTVYKYRKQRALNLGSWFVHENWMTPSLFQCAVGPRTSEIDIASGCNGTACARQILEQHWENFIVRADFQQLADRGINTVRLPIGYWNLGPDFCKNTPFANYADAYMNSWAFVVRAINMAAEVGIGVLIDMHGAVGSQNGQSHSGISDHHVGLFESQQNMDMTVACLEFLMRNLGQVTNVVGIQILNEPVDSPQLKDFYNRAISAMRAVAEWAAVFPLYIHDAFNLEEYSNFVSARDDWVIQDHHSYFVFTPKDTSESASNHTQEVRTNIANSLAKARDQARGNLIVGEWSCAMSPQSLASESDHDDARKKFCMTQAEVYYNNAAGWSFWSLYLENCTADWCFAGAAGSALPVDFLRYKSQCKPGPQARSIPDSPTNHRIAAVQERRAFRRQPQQQSNTKGYQDGFNAAQTFCRFDGSELGFKEQYIEDSMRLSSPSVITQGTEEDYRSGFLQGLSDGQTTSY